jgi:hypothetical protein
MSTIEKFNCPPITVKVLRYGRYPEQLSIPKRLPTGGWITVELVQKWDYVVVPLEEALRNKEKICE